MRYIHSFYSTLYTFIHIKFSSIVHLHVVNCGNVMVNILTHFFTARRKAIRRIWKIPLRMHNKLVHMINGSHDISIILEKRCIRQSCKMLNSEYELYY